MPEIADALSVLPEIGKILDEVITRLGRALPDKGDPGRGRADTAMVGLLDKASTWETARSVCAICFDTPQELTPETRQWLTPSISNLADQLDGKGMHRASSLLYTYAYRVGGQAWDFWSAISTAALARDFDRAADLAMEPWPHGITQELRERLGLTLGNLSFQIPDPQLANQMRLLALATDPSQAQTRPALQTPAAERTAPPTWEMRDLDRLTEVTDLWEAGQWSQASAQANATASERERGPMPLAVYVDVYIEAGWYEEALELANHLWAMYPRDPLVLMKMSLVALSRADHAAIEQQAREATRPTGIRVSAIDQVAQWYTRGRGYLCAGDLESIIDDPRYRSQRDVLKRLRAQLASEI